MTYRMIALDLDGTLKNSQNEITPKTKEALLDCSKQGMVIVLASGRPTPGLRHEAKELKLDEYHGVLLSFNGARVYDMKTKQVIYEQVISHEMAKQVYDRAKAYGLACLTYHEDGILTEDDQDAYVQIESRINDMPIIHTDNWKEAFDHDVHKVLLTGEPTYLAKIEEEFKAPFVDQLSIYRSSPYFLEVMAKGIDKANSLGKLCEQLAIQPSMVMAFGDGFNDISMIEFAGLGVAMGNAQEPVKAAADLITLSNDDDGIEQVINAYVFDA